MDGGRYFILACCLIFPLLSRGNASNPPASDPSTEKKKSPAQWLEVVQQQTVEAKKYEAAHPEETKLLYGATQATIPFLSGNNIAIWPTEYREGYEAYQAWWKSAGQAAFNQWREAGFPVSNDKHYLIFYAAAMGMYSVADKTKPENKDLIAYGDAILKRGREILLKGFLGEMLSAGEMDELRLFAMYDCAIDGGNEFPLPSYHNWMLGAPVAGDASRDFSLPTMEEILARPTYSDANPFDEMHLFRPDILVRFLTVMTGYEAADATLQKAGQLVQEKPYDGAFKNPVTLSSFKGKKPVVFMCEDASDTWTWSGEVVPLLGPLYEAVHDKVGIFLVHTTVHDQVMPGCVNNINAPDSRALHPTSLEVRARMAKMCYMTYPTLSVPCLLDDLGEHVLNAYQADGGGSSTFLVDTAGTIAFSQWQQPEDNDYMWLDCEPNNPYQVPARNERVMNLIECNIKAVLDAGGTWKKGTKPVVPDWKMSPMLQNVALTGVDVTKGQISTTDKNKAPLTIAVDAQSRIMQGKDHKQMADLRVGQTVSIYYQKDPAEPGWLAQLIVIGGPLDGYWYPQVSWVPAVVQSIDLQAGTIQAKMTLRVQDCKGMAFWKTASPEMIATFGPYAKSVPDTIKVVTSHVDQVLTIHIDRATEMFLDGMRAQLSDLKVGDHLGLELPNDLKPDDVWLHFIRDYRY